MNTARTALSLFGVLALLGLHGGVASLGTAHAGVRPGRAVEASAPQGGVAQAVSQATLPAIPAATVADMQLALAGFLGREAHLGRGVLVEDTRCEEASGGRCGAAFLREVAAFDPAAAEAIAPAVASLGDVTDLRVTAWTVEGDGATARGAVTLQGLRGGRVAGLVVYR